MTAEILHIRPVTEVDAQILFDWRNDDETRRLSAHPEPLIWETHVQWLAATLASKPPVRELFIVELESGDPIGTVRADTREDGYTEVSYTLAPQWRGKGLGKKMVVQFVREKLQGRKLAARIKKDLNPASEKIASAIGLSPAFQYQTDENETMVEWR